MESSVDSNALEQKQTQVIYGGFWPRVGALLLDTVILLPVIFPLTLFNITQWKSSILLVLVTLAAVSYKPFCEYKYGATLGKMALKLKVVNLEFNKANSTEILLRNIFHIVPPLFSLMLTLSLYAKPEFGEVRSFADYTSFSRQSTGLTFYNFFITILYLVDVVFLLTDRQNRTLHDRIGKTYVIVSR